MFIKKYAKIGVALGVVLVGGLSFYLLQENSETIGKGGVLKNEETLVPEKKGLASVVKKYEVTVAGTIDNTESGEEQGLVPVESVSIEPLQTSINSLEYARINGDSRTPPIVRPSIEREMPSPEELADPDLYQEYETRQNQKVYRSFYSASKDKLLEMENLMEKARSQGVSEDQLREGEEKISKMKAMREKLAQKYDDIAD